MGIPTEIIQFGDLKTGNFFPGMRKEEKVPRKKVCGWG
jgi:hypothetical protein